MRLAERNRLLDEHGLERLLRGLLGKKASDPIRDIGISQQNPCGSKVSVGERQPSTCVN
jgi:hypothetical protein